MKYIRQPAILIVTLLVPVILILTAVRITLSPLFIQIEYRLPGFPDDEYGFSFEERLYWANISRLYLLNREGITFLADQQLNDDTPLYNERELHHMVDVKNVVRGAMASLGVGLLIVLVLGYWARRSGKWMNYKNAISWGGWLTMGLIIAVMVYLGLNFNSLFTNFHLIFFEGDTWLFRYTDTLIRLFPIRFWRDAFIWVAALALTSGGVLGWFFPSVR